MPTPVVLSLDCYGIEITLNPSGEGMSGKITGCIIPEVCPHCSQPNCCYECDMSVAEFVAQSPDGIRLQPADDRTTTGTETEVEVAGRIKYNGAVDGVMALILAHACAGIDVTTPAYIEAIETAVDGIGNDI